MNRDNLRVVLVAPRNPLNIGAVARAMSNFGFFSLRLVDAYDVAFQEAKSAVNAAAVLRDAQVFNSVAEAVADCSLVVGTASLGNRSPQIVMRALDADSFLVQEAASANPVAILFGSEKFGLSNDDLSHCHWLLRIPTRAEHQSMNLGQAAAVVLYELARCSERARAAESVLRVADQSEIQRFAGLMEEALRLSGYLKAGTAETSGQKLRRLVQRMNLSTADAQVWTGMMRQILWKLNRTGDGILNPDDPS